MHEVAMQRSMHEVYPKEYFIFHLTALGPVFMITGKPLMGYLAVVKLRR